MSSVNFLEKLLDGVDVEWKTLGDTSSIYGGLTGKSKSDFDGGSAKYVTYKNIFANLNVDFSCLENVKVSASEKQHEVEHGDVLFTGSSEIAEEAGMSSVVTEHFEDPVYLNSFSFGVRFNQDVPFSPGFAKHLFRSGFMRLEIAKTASGVTRFNVSKERFRKIKVPIICPENPKKSLEIQAEIVRILDAFTELTDELTDELTARKKQYNYYRGQLLSFEDEEVEWKSLGEIVTTIKTGKLNANAMTEDGKYPFFTCDANPFRIDTYAFDTEAIIVSGNGSQVGHINYYKGKFNAYQRTYILADCVSDVTMEFLLTYLKAYLRTYIMQHSKKGSVPYITMPMLQNFQIPVPPIETQNKIASVLNKFDVLTSSLTEGLPREIELRQKQYEYYRDLLLSFPKPESALA